MAAVMANDRNVVPISSDKELEASTTSIEDSLAQYVREQFTKAQLHRRRLGLDAKMLACMRGMRMQYSAEEMALFAEVNVYPGLSSLKARAGESWITDILLNSIDKPWTLTPSPVPELPEWMQEVLLQELEADVMRMGVVDVQQLRSKARNLKDMAFASAQESAQHACDGMEKLIEDQMLEGSWREAFGQFVADLMVFPTAYMRAPCVENVEQLVWAGNEVKTVSKPLMKIRRIDPFDAFPAPDATSPSNGHFFIERARLAPERLHACIGVFGFSEDAIRYVLEEYPHGYIERSVEDAERRRLEYQETAMMESRTLDTIIYNGSVKGELLVEHGVLVPDIQKWYEAEIWCIANYAVKAVLNPLPNGQRPVFGTSYKKNNGSAHGESVISLLFDVERPFNSFIRAALKNAAYSAGPIGEVNTDRLGDNEKPNEVEPYKIYHTTPDLASIGGDTKAFHFQVIPNTVQELLDGASYFYKMADDISGIPAYVMGNPQVQGGGRTLGGLAMLMGNAAKGIKAVALNIDKDIVEPLVQLFYNYNMLTSEDQTIKADAKVLARGASGLLQRELAQNKLTDLLQLLTPYATVPIQGGTVLPPEAVQSLIREIVKSTGIDISRILPDPNQAQNTTYDLRASGIQTAFDRGAGQPVPLPPQSTVPSQAPTPINLPQGA